MAKKSGLTREEVFDALELLEAVVMALYGEQKNVSSLASRIVKNRGPLKQQSG